jgi:hypothetical protein
VVSRRVRQHRTRWRAVKRHVRNPIKWHGDAPRDHFTMIPNELARDTELSLYAYRIAIVIRTHAEDYEVSAASLAKMWGWHRDTVGKALRELAQAGWLVVRTYKTAEGKRVFDEYHIHASRRFTEAEVETWGQPVILPTPAYGGGIALPSEQAAPCLADRHPSAYGVGTKEDQLEHQPEKQQEYQASESNSDCWGCRELGPGCIIHAPKRELVSVGISEPDWPVWRTIDDEECPF